MSDTPTRLCWVDVETTGLDPAVDLLLEASFVITDAESLDVFDRLDLLLTVDVDLAMEMADDVVREMHTESGLWRDLAGTGTTWLVDAGKDIADFLAANTSEDERRLHVAGSNPAFDRSFLVEDLPHLDAFLHYRCFDVRSFITARALWLPDTEPYEPAKRHRATDDVFDAIATARHFRRLLADPVGR